MKAASFADEAETLSRSLVVQAIWPAAAVVGLLVTAPFAVSRPFVQFGLDTIVLIAIEVAVAAGMATLFYSTVILFDALLFRMMTGYEDEQTAGRAVDDLLVRMRLKPKPPHTRSVAERALGTNRLLARQRLAFAACLLIAGAAFSGFRF